MSFQPAQEPIPNPAPNEPQIRTGSTVPHHGCSACHQVFPETMMTAVGQRWVCLLCKERALDDPMAKERARWRMSSYVPNYGRWAIALTIAVVVGRFAFFSWMTGGLKSKPGLVGLRDLDGPAQVAEPWAKKTPAEWPILVTAGAATFKSPLFLSSPQACFVKSDDGTLLGLTTVGLAPNPTVKVEEITPEKLESEIAEWRLGPAETALKFTKPRPSGMTAFGEGVVVFQAPAGTKAPIQTLTVRARNYQAGAPAFAIVRNAAGGQNVYPGRIVDNASSDGSAKIVEITMGSSRTVYQQGDGSSTRVAFDKSVRVGDLRGAPLVDSDGLLMAIVTAPLSDLSADQETKNFFAFGMQALRDAVNLTSSGKRPMERTASGSR